MNTSTSSHDLHGWNRSLLIANQGRPWGLLGPTTEAANSNDPPGSSTRSLAARVWRRAVRGLARLSRPREPRNAQELIEYAQTLEKTMPNLATELRCLACRD